MKKGNRMPNPEFHLIKSESVPLTRELAERFQAMEPSPTERVLNPKRVQYLREQAEATPSRLVNFHWATAQLGNRIVRMNGNHSSRMLCELDGAFPSGLFVHRDDYEVNSEEGLALLFRQFDNRKSSRTIGDVAGAYQNIYPALRDVKPRIGKLAVDAYAWHARYVVGIPTPQTGDDVYMNFNDPLIQRTALWMNEELDVKTPEMQRIPVGAAMFVTFNINEPEARMFWHEVARGGREFEEAAPSSVLDKWLKNIKEGEVESVKPAGLYQGCIHAWNAFRTGTSLKSIRSDTKKGYFEPVE
jgi:hypothetical protein